jgi:O-antigen biosynthesis protein WbqV
LIRLSGLEPGSDIQIVFTGTRPGEKLTEALWEADTPLEPTSHPDIHRLAARGAAQAADLRAVLDSLEAACRQGDTDSIVTQLTAAVPGAVIGAADTQSLYDPSSLT